MEVGAAIMHACSAGIAQLVERNLAKVEVGSSRLLSRSRFSGGKRMSLRFPLLVSIKARSNRGGVAKWLCSGLQSRLRRFDSDPRLQSSSFRAFTCPDGEIGRRKGLKIPRPETVMPVRFRPRAPHQKGLRANRISSSIGGSCQRRRDYKIKHNTYYA